MLPRTVTTVAQTQAQFIVPYERRNSLMTFESAAWIGIRSVSTRLSPLPGTTRSAKGNSTTAFAPCTLGGNDATIELYRCARSPNTPTLTRLF